MIYSVKANAFDSVHNWLLTEEAITREQNGIKNLVILFGDIKRVRLYYNPMRCMANNYECEILTVRKQRYKIRSSSFESFANFESQAESYVPFIMCLIEMLSQKNPHVELIAGYSKKGFLVNYTLSFLIIAAVGYLLEHMVGRWISAMVMISYGIYFLRNIKKNWPKNIMHQEIPEKVLPVM